MRGGPNDGTLKPKIIEIERSMSRPLESNAPSFLTTFPAEVRNALYQSLFERDPVVLMEPGSYCKRPSWDEKFGANSDNPPNEPPGYYSADKTGFIQTPHDLAPNIPFLLACRQVYHEAIGVLSVWGQRISGHRTVSPPQPLPCPDQSRR